MNEANKIKEEEEDVGLTTATLAGVGAHPEVRAVAASTFGVGGASSVGAATAPTIDEQAAPLFSPEETKDFRASGVLESDESPTDSPKCSPYPLP